MPEAAGIIEKLQKAKLNQTQTLTALVAIQIAQSQTVTKILTKTEENCQGIRDVRADICELKGALIRKAPS